MMAADKKTAGNAANMPPINGPPILAMRTASVTIAPLKDALNSNVGRVYIVAIAPNDLIINFSPEHSMRTPERRQTLSVKLQKKGEHRQKEMPMPPTVPKRQASR